MIGISWRRVGCALALVVCVGCKSGLLDEYEKADGAVATSTSDRDNEGIEAPDESAGASNAGMTGTVEHAVPRTPGATAEDAGPVLASLGSDATIDGGRLGTATPEAGTTSPGTACNAGTLWEPNNAASFACLVHTDEALETQLPVDDGSDYFLLSVRSGAIYTLEIFNPEGCGLRYSVGQGVDGSRGSLVPSSSTDNGASHNYLGVVREFTAREDGYALLAYSAYNSGGCLRYGFVVRTSTNDGLSHDTLTLEPNNSASTATIITVGTPVTRQKLSPPADQFDSYRFAIRKDVTYSLHIENSQRCSLRYSVGLGEDGQRMSLLKTSTTDTRNSHNYSAMNYEFTASEDGIALMQFDVYSGSECLSYGFTIYPSTDAGLIHDALTGEPNETPSTAFLIVTETEIQASLTPPADIHDYYRLPVTVGNYTLELLNPQTCGLKFEVGLGVDGQRDSLVAPASTDTGASHNYPSVSRTFTVREANVALVHVTQTGESVFSDPAPCPSYALTIKRAP